MVQKRRPVQGNLDPLALLAGGTALDRSIDAILVAFSQGPFIHALGQRVSFVEGEGPRLDALKGPAALQTLRAAVDHAALEPVYETIARVRQDLPPAATFLGFCGAPWTLATYMIAGQGTPDQLPYIPPTLL